MLIVVPSRPWGRIKPGKGKLVIPGHPTARGLRAAYLLNENGGNKAYDACRIQAPATCVTPSWQTAAMSFWHGPHHKGSSTTYINLGAIQNFNTFSWIAGVTPVTAPSIATIVGGSNGNLDPFLRLNPTIEFGKYGTGVLLSGATTVVAGKPYVVGVSHTASGAIAVYLNGLLDGSNSAGTTFSFANLLFGNGGDSNGFNQGALSWFYVWNRALSAREHLLLAQEPYAFIEPPSLGRRNWALTPPLTVTLDEVALIDAIGYVTEEDVAPFGSAGYLTRDEDVLFDSRGQLLAEEDAPFDFDSALTDLLHTWMVRRLTDTPLGHSWMVAESRAKSPLLHTWQVKGSMPGLVHTWYVIPSVQQTFEGNDIQRPFATVTTP